MIVAILILDKVDFKTKTVPKDKEGHTYHRENSPTRRYSNCTQFVCTQNGNTQIYKVSVNPHEGNNQKEYNIYRGLEHPIDINK